MIETPDNVTAVYEKKREQKRQRNLFFCVPSRIILNEKGTSFFIGHNKPLHCFETTDGARDFGFYFEKTGFSWLKKLLSNNYLKKMEIQVKDISACRTGLEDAVKLVFFSMFRRRVNLSILEHIYNSSMVRTWNRANPKKSIGPGMKTTGGSFRELLNSREPGVLEELKAGLFRKIVQSLPSSFIGQREDARDIYSFVTELVGGISPLVFFILSGSGGEERFAMIQNISAGIIECIHRLDIVNLAALFTIELAAAAERSALVRMLENAGNVQGILENPEKRKSTMEEKRFRGSTVVMSVPGEIPPENRRIRFRISVYNDGADAEAERKLMEDFTERSFNFKDGRDLGEFFKTSLSRRDSDIYGDNGLYFYYLNALRNQCGKNKILLDTAIKNSHSGKSVVTTLWFGF
ncbi:MAG: hypothetical protein LBP29_04565 [Treponema sp.]|jgi:hypothetical protein|nr:hypothetical protein [Treponema sp.]